MLEVQRYPQGCTNALVFATASCTNHSISTSAAHPQTYTQSTEQTPPPPPHTHSHTHRHRSNHARGLLSAFYNELTSCTMEQGYLPWVGAGRRRWRRPPPRPLRCHSPHPPCASHLSPPGRTPRTGAPPATLCCSTARCCSCAALLDLQMANSCCC